MATSITPQTQSISLQTDDGSPAARVVTAPSRTAATEAVSPPEKGEPSGPGLSPPVPLTARNIIPSAPQVKPRGLAMPSATICMPVVGVASWARDVRGMMGTSDARTNSNANATREVGCLMAVLRSRASLREGAGEILGSGPLSPRSREDPELHEQRVEIEVAGAAPDPFAIQLEDRGPPHREGLAGAGRQSG